ncbi:hypothetical protein CBL_01117 [Carabus blaptoides fortunei]
MHKKHVYDKEHRIRRVVVSSARYHRCCLATNGVLHQYYSISSAGFFKRPMEADKRHLRLTFAKLATTFLRLSLSGVVMNDGNSLSELAEVASALSLSLFLCCDVLVRVGHQFRGSRQRGNSAICSSNEILTGWKLDTLCQHTQTDTYALPGGQSRCENTLTGRSAITQSTGTPWSTHVVDVVTLLGNTTIAVAFTKATQRMSRGQRVCITFYHCLHAPATRPLGNFPNDVNQQSLGSAGAHISHRLGRNEWIFRLVFCGKREEDGMRGRARAEIKQIDQRRRVSYLTNVTPMILM